MLFEHARSKRDGQPGALMKILRDVHDPRHQECLDQMQYVADGIEMLEGKHATEEQVNQLKAKFERLMLILEIAGVYLG